MVDVKIRDLMVPVVVDTGCTQTMLRADLVPPQAGEEEMPMSMVCIHGNTYTYQRKYLRLTVMGRMEELVVGLAETLSCLMLLDVDWPYF